MTPEEWMECFRQNDEGEVVEEIEITNEELAKITAHESLKAIAEKSR